MPPVIKRDIEREAKQHTYRAYVTDALKAIAENTAIDANKFLEEPVGKAPDRRWADFGKSAPPKDTRTGVKIAADVIKNAGLIVKQKSA